VSTDERCSYSVPESWRVSADRRWAAQEDGAASLGVFGMSSTNWSSHRNAVMAGAPTAVVHEDSATRLWIEGSAGARVWQHVLVNGGNWVCTGDLAAGHQALRWPVVQQIVSTLRVSLER